MSRTTDVLHVPSWVVHREIGERSVVVNLRTGQYHGLNGTGRIVLEALDGRSPAEAVEHLVAGRGWSREVVEAEVRAFTTALLQRGLVEAGRGA